MLYKTRQWRKLLSFIDNLPSHTKTQEAMANDREYIKAALKAGGGSASSRKGASTPLSEWTPPVSLLASVVDELRALKAVIIKANSKPGAATPKVEQVPRPKTVWDDIALEERLARHERLADRLLGDRRKKA